MAIFVRWVTGLRQFICGVHGHEALLHFDRRHVSLVCLNCGYESPGWDMPGAPAATGGISLRQPARVSSSSRRSRSPHVTQPA
jgi:hypothetical protein